MIGLLWLLLFGLIVGAIAKFIVPGTGIGGIIGDIIVGILGALLGGWLYSLFGGHAGFAEFNLPSIVCGVIGAVVLLWILRALSGRRTV
jgi:uncharacterized membrane protein YeaQ/YmgE (transglycosylase-associated protein family)